MLLFKSGSLFIAYFLTIDQVKIEQVKMRLTPQQRSIIKENVKMIFGSQAEVLLFGSRVDDSKRGGDIDLLIKLEQSDNKLLKKNLTLNAALQVAMGGLQKIDIITHVKITTPKALYKAASSTGIKL